MMEQLVATVRDLEARGEITQCNSSRWPSGGHAGARPGERAVRHPGDQERDIQVGSVSITVQRKDASQRSSGGSTDPCSNLWASLCV